MTIKKFIARVIWYGFITFVCCAVLCFFLFSAYEAAIQHKQNAIDMFKTVGVLIAACGVVGILYWAGCEVQNRD